MQNIFLFTYTKKQYPGVKTDRRTIKPKKSNHLIFGSLGDGNSRLTRTFSDSFSLIFIDFCYKSRDFPEMSPTSNYHKYFSTERILIFLDSTKCYGSESFISGT